MNRPKMENTLMKTAKEVIVIIQELPPEERKKVADYLQDDSGFYSTESQEVYRQALKEVTEGNTHPIKDHADLMRQLAS